MEVIQEEIKIDESKIDNNTKIVSSAFSNDSDREIVREHGQEIIEKLGDALEERGIKLIKANEVTPAMYDKMAEFMFKFGINTFYKSEEKHAVMCESNGWSTDIQPIYGLYFVAPDYFDSHHKQDLYLVVVGYEQKRLIEVGVKNMNSALFNAYRVYEIPILVRESPMGYKPKSYYLARHNYFKDFIVLTSDDDPLLKRSFLTVSEPFNLNEYYDEGIVNC